MATATKKATKKVKAPDVQVSFCTFDEPGMYFNRDPHDPTFRVVRESKLGDWKPLTAEDYTPRGGTPLLDATAKFIFHLDSLRSKDTVTVGLLGDESGSMGHLREAVIDGLNEFVGGLAGVDKVDAEVAGKTLAVIFTDGAENASKEYDREAVAKLVAEREADGWAFVFLGAEVNAWAQGGYVGMSGGATGQSVNFVKSPKGMRSAMKATTNHGVGYLSENASYLAATAASGMSLRSITEDGDEIKANTGEGKVTNAEPNVPTFDDVVEAKRETRGKSLADGLSKARDLLTDD